MNPLASAPADASSPLTPLADVLSRRERVRTGERQIVRCHVGSDWQQGRTTFGGVLSALALQAMRDVCGKDWPLRALQTNFVGPVSPGHFDIEVVLLRQGKSIRQVQARVLQADETGREQVGGVLLGVFGAARASTLPELRPSQPPVAKDPDAALLWPYVPGLTPTYTQHLEFRQAEGGVPFSGSAESHSRIYVRLRVADGIDSELQSVLLADAGPTPALAQLKGFAPASSVSWALELRPVTLTSDAGLWRMDKDALATGDGYINEKTTLWAPDGQLAALGYQVVAVYG